MLTRLIDDVYKSLKSEAYLAALALALTLPDVCGKAEFPEENHSGPRYKAWYDEHIGKYEKCPCKHCKNTPMPYLSGEVVYSLRNFLLHQGTPNIDKKNGINHFELVLEPENQFPLYSDLSCIKSNFTKEKEKMYRVNVRRLCLILCRSAKGYYEANIEKFNFFQCSIIDLTTETSKTQSSCILELD